MHQGVEREIAHSSSLMYVRKQWSAQLALAGIRQHAQNVAPLSACAATRSATANVPPEVVPTKNAFLLRQFHASAHRVCAGNPQNLADPSPFRSCTSSLESIGASSGSQTTIFISGCSLASTRATPFSVHPVPNP